MRKILNPYVKVEGYNCFACSPNNENGLQMQFVEDGDYVLCEWEPRGFLQGYHNILHGGIQATLMDEIASWLVQVKLKTAGVTSRIDVRLKRPVPTDQGPLHLVARLHGKRRNLADIWVELHNPDGSVGAEGMITYYTFREDVAREKLNYPGYEEFFEGK